MASRTISVRVSAEELDALRRVPGSTDSERVRSLIHSEALADAIAEATAARIGERIDALEHTQDRLIEIIQKLARRDRSE